MGAKINMPEQENKDLIEEIIQQIIKADEQAFTKKIETNAIILNENFDFCQPFFHRSIYTNPMILGKHVFTAKLPEKYSFALTEVDKEYLSELEYYKRRCKDLEAKLDEIKEVLNIDS